jgi:hypothetical protein
MKSISFSGYKWAAKSSKTPVGPGPNYFSDNNKNVWTDKQGYLHLIITDKNGNWHCAEIISEKSFGYGKYVFCLANEIEKLDKNVVLGLFTYDDSLEYNHREIDIEFSKWGKKKNKNAQFMVQPKNKYRFDIQSEEELTCIFDWQSNKISSQVQYNSWIYAGKDIPEPNNEKTRINFWLFKGRSPSDKNDIEIVIKKFVFNPIDK